MGGDNEYMSDLLTIAGKTFPSRLFVGTGKYRSKPLMARCHEISGTGMVTLAVRRVNLTDRSKESELDFIDRSKIWILPNTAGCYTADEAIRTARLAREVGLSNWIKLEVIGCQHDVGTLALHHVDEPVSEFDIAIAGAFRLAQCLEQGFVADAVDLQLTELHSQAP